jgi:transcriptional regulator with XRE-family HTH domain
MSETTVHPLRAYRGRKALSLSALARQVGTSKATLSRIENGRQEPSLALVAKIKAATRLSADAFLRRPQ